MSSAKCGTDTRGSTTPTDRTDDDVLTTMLTTLGRQCWQLFLTTIVTIVFDDNVDNFRPDQLPGATRSKIYNNLDNNNQQLATESTPSVAQGGESLWQIDVSPFATATLTTGGTQSKCYIYHPCNPWGLKDKTMKKNFQLIVAIMLCGFGCGLLLAGFVLPPLAEIHQSILIAFGEILTFSGSLIGIDYKYRYKE